MKLFYSPPSPYVRKVLVFAHEVGLAGSIELAPASTTPLKADAGLARANPLAKMPTLVADDGTALFDSRVICEYLDSLHDGARLFPEEPAARWRALTGQALADGILDAAVSGRYETAMRPEDKQWDAWIAGQKDKIFRALDTLEAGVGGFEGRLDIGTIACACALGYLDFRYAADPWRDSRPRLAAWFADFDARPSMRATVPPA